MRSTWKDAAHLIRPAIVFLVGLGIFGLLRSAVVPPSFGKYGHYRADALDVIRAKPVKYAGQEACAPCHADQTGVRNKGKHSGIACEACHGPAAAHAADPSAGKPSITDPQALCARCHEQHAAKPEWFKQVVIADHMGGAPCQGCHQPHSPAM